MMSVDERVRFTRRHAFDESDGCGQTRSEEATQSVVIAPHAESYEHYEIPTL